MNVAIYSAIYGNYEAPKPQVHDLGVPMVMYTDNEQLECPGWQMRYAPMENHAAKTSMMKAKWWKCRPDLALPTADVTLWIDGSMTVNDPAYVEKCLAKLGAADALFYVHPWRNCIYDEVDASINLPKYAGCDLWAQVRTYQSLGHPPNWGLFAAGAITRRNNSATRELGERWWRHCLEWSWQDQLSLPFIVRGMSEIGALTFNTFGAGDPWRSWWTIDEH